MLALPQLVGTGTAIAAAASGLVFGQPTESGFSSTNNNSTSRRRTHKRHRSNTDCEPSFHPRLAHLTSRRPATSAAIASTGTDEPPYYTTLPRPPSSSRPPPSRYQRPLSRQFTPPKLGSRRSSYANQAEPSTPTIPEVTSDSVSSNGSWLRRLSIRPLSRHESCKSSAGLDSPSIFSHGSSAPILSPAGSAAPPLPPNKLVKRAPPDYHNDANAVPRRRTKSHLPPFRRPATSHQRSATLHQFQPPSDVVSQSSPRKFSFDQLSRTRSVLTPSPVESGAPPATPAATKPAWASFFHSRTASLGGRSGTSRLSELGPSLRSLTSKRIRLGGNENPRVHLVKPRMVSSASAPPILTPPAEVQEEPDRPAEPESEAEQPEASQDDSPNHETKRSLSMSLSSAGIWVSKTSGSLRRPKRGDEPKDGNKRHVSDPTNGFQPAAGHGASTPLELAMPAMAQEKQGSALDSAGNVHLRTRKRNSSSPLPPLSRLSSFNVDMSRLGTPSGVPAHHVRPNQPSGSSTSSTAMSQLRSTHHDRSSTMASSEGDTRECTSGDDDDTDFKSDTMFDSLRTVASGRNRAVDTPLDSLYDESPPSTAGNGRKKRLSIQEILGKSWDEDDNRILEEDENMSTPVRTIRRIDTGLANQEMPPSPRFSIGYLPEDISPTTKDFGRLSFEDDFDEDWALDDDALCNPLSPPSKGSSLNSRGMNPKVRLALENISGNGFLEVPPIQTPIEERPLSNIFDWSESSIHDRSDADGMSPRPKTACAKQELDSRGGRLAIRKVPAPLHVRSQSVPVLHDLPDQLKPNGAKYGTWGLGTKTASEDWDDDFEFGGSNVDNEDKDEAKLFPVPESIRATQPSVKAHSGQIRELSLLVNDLKRLCRHGRDMDMLDGSSRTLWKEAEGIIALASPDEDSDSEDSDSDSNSDSNSSTNLDAFELDQRHSDVVFDAAALDRLDAAFDGNEPAMSKTAVVRERHSPRRRSVFSPEDDIFGNWSMSEGTHDQSNRTSRPRTPENRPNKPNDVNGAVRSVMEAMQHRPISEPVLDHMHKDDKMHFDTNSLKALVKRAGDLRDALSDLIRRADQITSSPIRTPKHERQSSSSPAFTRVFDDPGSSPPRRLLMSRGNTSIRESTPDRSPSGLPQRLQMMTVG